MTDETTPKKPGRPRKATAQPAQDATTPQDSPVQQSKAPEGTQVPAEAEIDTQRLEVDHQTAFGVVLMHASLARHMVKEHRMTWGEARISLGYGFPKQDPQQDELWDTVYRMAQA